MLFVEQRRAAAVYNVAILCSYAVMEYKSHVNVKHSLRFYALS